MARVDRRLLWVVVSMVAGVLAVLVAFPASAQVGGTIRVYKYHDLDQQGDNDESLAGSNLTGWVFDSWGSYTPAFFTLAGAAGLALGLTLSLPRREVAAAV